MNVTACLIVWRRQQNIPEIVESLLRWPFISEVIVRDNSKCDNIINYGRYTSALKAENDVIYTQDDDCIVDSLGDIYNQFVKDSSRVAYSGIPGYEEKISENIFGEKQMAMAGWGFMFDRRWIPVLGKYIDKYGKDNCFYRETDRIFSILLNRHHNYVPGGVRHLEGKDGPEALCQQPEHLDYKKLAIERALSL